MKLHNLVKIGNSDHTRRRGRGDSSGRGGTSGRGHKGGKARSGYSPAPCCCGIPYYRRLPKRGFKNFLFKTNIAIVNISGLARIIEDVIDKEILFKYGLINKPDAVVKVLGAGELERKVTVKVDFFSAAAEKKILALGGTVVRLNSATGVEN
ncbi:MAG: 50S ribosomal protein L15 [Puniceicoccales bacterium]|jgi:large subunit ribosomal protein L15|nr:50S ribosomal protein L15 [Puniceicoccales bacterium]